MGITVVEGTGMAQNAWAILTLERSGAINLEETDAVTIDLIEISTDESANDDIDDIQFVALAGDITIDGQVRIGAEPVGVPSIQFGDISLDARMGSILDSSSDATLDIIADEVTLRAVTGIGTITSSLDTAVNRLNVRTNSGAANLEEADAVTVALIEVTTDQSVNDDVNDIQLTALSGDISIDAASG